MLLPRPQHVFTGHKVPSNLLWKMQYMPHCSYFRWAVRTHLLQLLRVCHVGRRGLLSLVQPLLQVQHLQAADLNAEQSS